MNEQDYKIPAIEKKGTMITIGVFNAESGLELIKEVLVRINQLV